MKKLTVELGKNSYPIFIYKTDLKKLSHQLIKLGLSSNVIIITMKSISNLYKEDLEDNLKRKNFNTFFEIVPDSEKSKSFQQLNKCTNNISNHVKGNPFFLVAFGGGVVGDLCGFIASIYKRGVDYIQLPTTLLSQIDSSIGGKVAIDLDTGKNLVGAFYQPKMVYININFLETLSEREISSGIAEAIKYGIIEDRDLFNLLENIGKKKNNKIYDRVKGDMEKIVYNCTKIKSKIVSLDEKDIKGIRTKLNFGHTIGHAIEAASDYSKLYNHGEAISVGMICATEISKRMGILKKDILNKLELVLKNYKLPLYIHDLNIEKLMQFFWYDKKFTKGIPRMILPIELGKVKIVENIPVNIVKETIRKRIKS